MHPPYNLNQIYKFFNHPLILKISQTNFSIQCQNAQKLHL